MIGSNYWGIPTLKSVESIEIMIKSSQNFEGKNVGRYVNINLDLEVHYCVPPQYLGIIFTKWGGGSM